MVFDSVQRTKGVTHLATLAATSKLALDLASMTTISGLCAAARAAVAPALPRPSSEAASAPPPGQRSTPSRSHAHLAASYRRRCRGRQSRARSFALERSLHAVEDFDALNHRLAIC